MFRPFVSVRSLLLLLLPLIILVTLSSSTPAAAVPAPPTVAAGTSHSCARLSGGALKCWGDNSFGQLGDGTTFQRLTPVGVSGLSSGVSGVVAGSEHTCALTTAGAAKCWGENSFGQLGNGTNTQFTTPTAVSGLTSGVANIAAGAEHSCAITTAGALKCWGYNADGELGDNSTTDNPTPGTVSGLNSGIAAVAAGAYHTCAVTTAGAAKCWGYNSYGELGTGTTTNRLTPASVSGLSSGVAALAAGSYHTCALTTAGAVKCWGFNGYGELGDGSTTDRLSPVTVSGLTSGVAAISAGAFYTCALTTTGAVKCWGYNSFGQLGDGGNSSHSTPTQVVGLSSNVVALSAGYDHTCALTSAGGAKCWGYNSEGELGNGSTMHSSTPVNVTGTFLDSDGDTVADADDNCPKWANASQALPAWPIPAGDADCDGFPDTVDTATKARETYIGTDPLKHCAATSAPNDEGTPDAMPPDFNDDRIVNGQDSGKFGGPAGSYNQTVADGPFGGIPGARFDFNGDGLINGQDTGKFQAYFNRSCA